MTSRFFKICSDGQWRPSEVDWSLVFRPRFQLDLLSCSDAKRYKEKGEETRDDGGELYFCRNGRLIFSIPNHDVGLC